MKYGIWNTAVPVEGTVETLCRAGYDPLTARVLSVRGVTSSEEAQRLLNPDQLLQSPFLLPDMDKAADRIRLALKHRERMAVFGDYDVDGVTATCILVEFLRSCGGNCIPYIPSRLEEGYGLNGRALERLSREGVTLVITVDCGITALEEAELCRSLHMDLIITDHHECKDSLPNAVAVVDPHRRDCGCENRDLSGAGVAFKLADALCGDRESLLSQWTDLACLGTVADVMPLLGENRTLVYRGLEEIRRTKRPGLAALMEECGCKPEQITAGTIGYVIAPRINAAGRMGNIDVAMELLMTQDRVKAARLAKELCQLNRRRQEVESEIYRQAVAMIPAGQPPEAIVLASEEWHQGVAGIVASRLSEEYCRPAFLICLDGSKGKASARSWGNFHLFAALQSLAPLLETYGGHALAAGFTIARDQIDPFREKICAMVRECRQEESQAVLTLDCTVSPEYLTLENVAALSRLEPCGASFPRPLFLAKKLQIEQLQPVGGGKHLRLRLRSGRQVMQAIYFSATSETASVEPGDWVDLAFAAQINEYRGIRSVQLNVTDIRPFCPCEVQADSAPYRRLKDGKATREDAENMLPDRRRLADVWTYLSSYGGEVQEDPVCLCRKIVRRSGRQLNLSQLLSCLDIFDQSGLLQWERAGRRLVIRICASEGKKDLTQCEIMQLLLHLKGG